MTACPPELNPDVGVQQLENACAWSQGPLMIELDSVKMRVRLRGILAVLVMRQLPNGPTCSEVGDSPSTHPNTLPTRFQNHFCAPIWRNVQRLRRRLRARCRRGEATEAAGLTLAGPVSANERGNLRALASSGTRFSRAKKGSGSGSCMIRGWERAPWRHATEGGNHSNNRST